MASNPLMLPDDTVRGSWFGNAPGWTDPSDSGLQASGVPVAGHPGIALPTRNTLGQWFKVTTPDGRVYSLPQTDIGPAKWTGRGVDINAAAAEAMGYKPSNFPTDAGFKVEYAGGSLAGTRYKTGLPGSNLASASHTAPMDLSPMLSPLQADSGVVPTPPVLPQDSLPEGYGAGHIVAMLGALGVFGSKPTHKFEPIDYDPWKVAQAGQASSSMPVMPDYAAFMGSQG